MLWRDNWVTLIDGLLQLNVLRQTHDGVSVPKQIGCLSIDVTEHSKHKMDLDGETVMRAEVYDVYNYTRCGGIVIKHLKLKNLPLESEDNFALKALQFVPRICNNLDFVSTLHVYLQIVAENVNRNYVNIVSLVNYKDAKIFKEIKNVLTDIMNINFKYEEINIQYIKENIDTALADVDVVLLHGLSTDDNICQLLYRKLRQNSFVVSEEDNTLEKRIRPSAVYRTVSVSGELQLVRWRPSRVSSNRSAVSVFFASDIPLLIATRKAMQPEAHLLVLTTQPPPQGLKDLIRTWRTEPVRNQVSLVVMDSRSPDELMDTDMQLAFNVLNKGQWGGEYYVPIQEKYERGTRAILESARIGDIGSLHWVQGQEPLNDGVKVNVHYAALNTVDMLKATGRIPFENENESSSRGGYGMDFSGVTESGARVMGVVSGGACSSEVRAAPELLWPVPEHWTLEDAATVPLPYISAFYCFLRTISRTRLVDKSEEYTLLVHGGAGALGQAAISIGLGLGYEVFTTVSDVKKKQFLMRLYPQLKGENIGNSRDNSFGDLVLRATNGKGCYIVINNLRGDLKNVSLQCCSDSGTTYDMSQLSHQENYMLPMSYLSRERSYVSIDISSVIKKWIIKDIKMLHAMVSEGIARGYVRPLSRVSYAPHAAPRALRLLAVSAHRGRVLLHLRDTRLHVLPRIICQPDEVQLILCDRSSLGLHLADRLISLGAKKLYVHCASLTPHLRYKLRSWQKRGVLVEASSEDLNKEGISDLMGNVDRLGTVGGIYVIATDASDKTDGKFLSALNKLDLESRKLWPTLRYFAVISSDMIGVQTCIDRVSNGYPATQLKFNLIETSVANEGGFELSASQSLGVVAAAERALHSPHPALLAHQLRAPHAPLLQQMAHVADISISEDVADDATLESFGVIQEKLERVRILLEMSYNIVLNEENIKALTIQRIQEIGETVIPTMFNGLKGLENFYTHVDPDELLATTELVFVSTLTSSASMRGDEFDVNQTYLCIVPGLEGLHNRFGYMCERLKLPALVLQPGLDKPNETIQETAKKYAQVFLKRIGHKDNFYILGYEWGVPMALEVAFILENQGKTGTVFCVGLEPEELKIALEEDLSEYKNEEELENGVLKHMFKLMTGDKCTGLDEMLRGCNSWDKKVEECVRTLLGRVSHSAQYTRALLHAALGRIAQARRYSSALPPLRSRVVLLRSRRAVPASPQQLNALTSGEVSVHELSAPLGHAARDARCAAIVNSYLDPELIHSFNNMNLCDSYLLNADTFMNASKDLD
ncbi:hypothetical protein O3G_MSEX012625 [Manduca sexta]|uniref:Enoyl reductase (ER) domain-containing protein n=1 Tax=Manduca sexta TaxID=7130 RepID=A0A922CXE0_MANSE|nr:hypothetical protein O3G_MSEX012625 [Manduca sexta]